MNRTAFTCIILLLLGSCKEKKKLWIDFEYDSAKAYYYENYRVDTLPYDASIIHYGKLNPGVYNPEGEKLTEAQINRLDSLLNGNLGGLEFIGADCYNPRHGIVFYKEQKPVAYISVCFDCHILSCSPKAKLVSTEPLFPFFEQFDMPVKLEDFPRIPEAD